MNPKSQPAQYRKIASAIELRVRRHDWPDRLPTLIELANDYRVGVVTMRRAIAVLKERGVVTAAPRRGIVPTRLKRPKSHSIAFIGAAVPGGPLHQDLRNGIQGAANEHHYAITQYGHNNSIESELSIIKASWDQARVDGFVIWPSETHEPSSAVAYLRAENIPFVLVPEVDQHAFAAFPTVCNMDKSAAAQVLAHLIQGGATNIGFALRRDLLDSLPGQERLAQYRTTLQHHKLPIAPAIVLPRYSDELIAPLPPDLPERLRQFDALFAATDNTAARIVRCCASHGIRIPEDLALVSFDNTPTSRILEISSVDQHFEKIGRLAFEQLLVEIDKPSSVAPHLFVESELIIRSSSSSERN